MLGGPHGRACRGHERFWAQHTSDHPRQTCHKIPMKRLPSSEFSFSPFPALADNPAAPDVHDVPALFEFKDVVTWKSVSPTPRAKEPVRDQGLDRSRTGKIPGGRLDGSRLSQCGAGARLRGSALESATRHGQAGLLRRSDHEAQKLRFLRSHLSSGNAG
jgi:hypothetical protein